MGCPNPLQEPKNSGWRSAQDRAGMWKKMAKQMQVAFFKTGLKGVAHVAGWLYLAP